MMDAVFCGVWFQGLQVKMVITKKELRNDFPDIIKLLFLLGISR